MSEQCPLCDSELREESMEYKFTDRTGVSWIIPEYVYSECDECESSFVSGNQARQNDENKTEVRTKYCPHCASDKVHRVDESDGSHFHECEDCQEAWEHH